MEINHRFLYDTLKNEPIHIFYRIKILTYMQWLLFSHIQITSEKDDRKEKGEMKSNPLHTIVATGRKEIFLL